MASYFNHLQRLPAPIPAPPRHNYGTPKLRSAHSRHSDFRPYMQEGKDGLAHASSLHTLRHAAIQMLTVHPRSTG